MVTMASKSIDSGESTSRAKDLGQGGMTYSTDSTSVFKLHLASYFGRL